jgi:hypothetical protein
MRAPASQAVTFKSFTPPRDARVVYVSSTQGNDANDGLSAQTPKATLQAGYDLLRSGFPDQLRLRAGDSWTTKFPTWKKSGRGPGQPMLVSTYGNQRYRANITVTDETAITALKQDGDPDRLHDLAFQGLRLELLDRENATDDRRGFQWIHPTDRLLIEDVETKYFRDGISIDAVGGRSSQVSVERCVIRDSCVYSESHSEGAYFNNVDGLRLYENLFDHNGWDLETGDSAPTVFRHNCYVQASCTGLEAIGNFFVRGASHGIQARPGGRVVGNVFFENPHNLLIGTDWETAEPVTASVFWNVVQGSRDIVPVTSLAGYGIEMLIGSDPSGEIAENLILNGGGSQRFAMQIGNNEDLTGLSVRGNVVRNWGGPILINGTTGGGMSGCTFEENDCAEVAGPIFQQGGSGQYATISYAGNVFACPAANFASVGGGATTYAAWSAAATQSGNSHSATQPAAALSLVDCAENLGLGRSVDALIRARARMTRGSWNERYSGINVARWMLERAGIPHGLDAYAL